MIDAFWLPGLNPGDVVSWDARDLGAAGIRWPALRPDQLRRVLKTVAAAGEELGRTPVSDIVRAIDAAAARLADPGDPLRGAAESALPLVTGYSPAMVRLVLDHMAADWRRPALERLLRSELGDPGVLEGFVADPRAPGRRVHALGPRLGFHIFAGNVPGVAVTSLVRSLLVRAPALGKTAAGEPVLAPLFARALDSVAPRLAAALALTYWPGGTPELEEVALAAADTLVAYGGEEMMRELGARVPPGTRVLDHGPRYSFGLVGREALQHAVVGRTAQQVAAAVAAFDQQGCVSPHLVYVERSGETDPAAFAGLVAGALEALEAELPRGSLTPAEAVAIHQARGAAEFRAIAGAEVSLHAGPGTSFTVAYDADPVFVASCLNRFLWVKPLAELEQVLEHVRPFRAFLQTVAIAGAGERRPALAAALARAGASRITTFEAAPWPPPDWHHDGRGPLLELLRWVDLEL